MNKNSFLRIVKYLLVAASAGIIEFGTFTLLTLMNVWPYWPCYLIALVLSVLWNFTLNRKYTFRSTANVPVAMFKVAVYYAIFTPLTTIGGNYLAESMGWNDFLVTIMNMLLNCLTEYLYQRYVVFGKTIDTRVDSEDGVAVDQDKAIEVQDESLDDWGWEE